MNETIQIDENTRIVVEFDNDYEIDPEEGEMTQEEINAENLLIDTDGVYIVSVEQRTEWKNTATGAIRHEWEKTDSIGGCFLSDDYTARDVVSEFFPID